MAHGHGWSTVFASFEQSPQVDHRRALRSFHAGRREIEMTMFELDERPRTLGELVAEAETKKIMADPGKSLARQLNANLQSMRTLRQADQHPDGRWYLPSQQKAPDASASGAV